MVQLLRRLLRLLKDGRLLCTIQLKEVGHYAVRVGYPCDYLSDDRCTCRTPCVKIILRQDVGVQSLEQPLPHRYRLRFFC